MKKTILLIIIYGFCVSRTTSLQAQKDRHALAFTDSRRISNSVVALYHELGLIDLATAVTIDNSSVDGRALRDFAARFHHAAGTRWFEVPTGFLSYFHMDGIPSKAWYDQHGHWQYTLRTYGEDQMPMTCRQLVYSAYADYAITLVDEVESAQGRGFVVHLENAKRLKNIRLRTDGSMSVISDLRKQ